MEPNALEVRRVAAGAQAFVAVAVVRGAALGVREDLVCLRGFLELALGVGVVRVDVGVQLSGEAAEGFLDLLLACVARDAENLVGVAWHGAHACVRVLDETRELVPLPRAPSRSPRHSPCAPGRSPTPSPACAGPSRSRSQRPRGSAEREARSHGRCGHTRPARRGRCVAPAGARRASRAGLSARSPSWSPRSGRPRTASRCRRRRACPRRPRRARRRRGANRSRKSSSCAERP